MAPTPGQVAAAADANDFLRRWNGVHNFSLAPDLAGRVPEGGTLFIIARRGAGGGPPLAVRRIPSPRFPLEFSIGPENVMIPGVVFEGDILLSVGPRRTSSYAEARDAFYYLVAGQGTTLGLLRGTKLVELTVIPEVHPAYAQE